MTYSDESYSLGPEDPEWKTRKDAILFDADSVKIFNQGLPLALLRKASSSPRLPSNLRQKLAMMTWVRAILLENHAAARAVSGDLARNFPELKPHLDSYLTASDRDAQRFAAAYLLLKSPQLKPYLKSGFPTRRSPRGIDSFRENWWCSFSANGDLDSPAYYIFSLRATGREERTSRRKEPVAPVFLMDSEREALRAEWERLLKLDTAPNYLGNIVARWARKNPNDPRTPEALHLAVKATRFGCTNQESGRYSQEAFRILHQNYPSSPWAMQTPFWYR
jgi:hypothetical protein